MRKKMRFRNTNFRFASPVRMHLVEIFILFFSLRRDYLSSLFGHLATSHRFQMTKSTEIFNLFHIWTDVQIIHFGPFDCWMFLLFFRFLCALATETGNSKSSAFFRSCDFHSLSCYSISNDFHWIFFSLKSFTQYVLTVLWITQ